VSVWIILSTACHFSSFPSVKTSQHANSKKFLIFSFLKDTIKLKRKLNRKILAIFLINVEISRIYEYPLKYEKRPTQLKNNGLKKQVIEEKTSTMF
jgi:hypothetical protein